MTATANRASDPSESITGQENSVGYWALQIVHRIPSMLLVAAAILLPLSISKPYWSMHLDAVQYDYRGGLDILIYVDRMEGKDPVFDDLREINALNHYIGMRELDDAARFERSIALPAVILMAIGLLIAAVGLAIFRQRLWSKWFWLLTMPALFFPGVFVGDLAFWLRDSGQSLDCLAPLSFSIERFTPPLSGEGTVGQFTTTSMLDTGWDLTLYAAILIGAAMTFALLRYGIGLVIFLQRWLQERAERPSPELAGA